MMSNIVHLLSADIDKKFEEWWSIYPKKIAKPLCKAKFKAITNGGCKTRALCKDSGTFIEIELSATPEEIIEGARRFRKSQTDPNTYKLRDGGKYIPNPLTWLNQGRWSDGE